MGRDAPLGFGYFSLQPGDRLVFRLAARIGGLANPEPANFHRPQGLTVLPQLNPVPGDIAIAVSDHHRRPGVSLHDPRIGGFG
jgi:hypothetical protein